MEMQFSNAVISKIMTMSDRSVRVWLDLPELSPTELANVFAWLNNGTHTISTDIEDEDNGKSPSQRLRNTLYVLWEQKHKEKYPEFEVFYRAKMEKFIEAIKEKLI